MGSGDKRSHLLEEDGKWGVELAAESHILLCAFATVPIARFCRSIMCNSF